MLRTHWAKRRCRNQKLAIVLKSELNKHNIKLPCIITFIRQSPRKLDYDNLVMAFKFVRDFIADYLIPGKGLGVADSDPRITWLYEQEKAISKGFLIQIKSNI
jgi:hypothetical protein